MNWQLWVMAAAAFGCIALAGIHAARAGHAFLDRYHESFTSQARHNLADMFLFVDVRQLFLVNLLMLVLVPLLAWLATGSVLVAAVLAALLALLPRRVYRALRQRRIDRIQQQMPDGLMMLAGTMRAGLGFTPALEGLVRDGHPPLAQELALVLREQHLGVKTDEALAHFAERVPVLDAKLFVSAVAISREVGGNLGESLALLAETLRRRLVMEGKVKALTSQGKLQGIVMALLPVGMVAYLHLAYPDVMRPMFETPLGWTVIAIGAVMEYLGYRLCLKIMTIDV